MSTPSATTLASSANPVHRRAVRHLHRHRDRHRRHADRHRHLQGRCDHPRHRHARRRRRHVLHEHTRPGQPCDRGASTAVMPPSPRARGRPHPGRRPHRRPATDHGLAVLPAAPPVRLLDTRPGQHRLRPSRAPLAPNQPLTLPGRFTSGGVTIPAAAQALVGNATVDNSLGAPAGFATLYPSGAALPLASNLNFVPGTVRPNAFTVALGRTAPSTCSPTPAATSSSTSPATTPRPAPAASSSTR